MNVVLPRAVRCVVCLKAIRRYTTCAQVDGGRFAHRRCEGGTPKAEIPPMDRRSRGRSARGPEYRAARARVFALATRTGDWRCQWCWRETSPELDKLHPLAAVADHVIPGDHESLTIACRRCNRDKSDKSLEDWADIVVRRGDAAQFPGLMYATGRDPAGRRVDTSTGEITDVGLGTSMEW